MAQSVGVVSSPNPLSPINDSNRGSCTFILNGTSNIQQEDNFMYVIDLYELATEWNLTYSVVNNMGRYKLPAGPDGRCVFSANQILQSQTLNDYVPTFGDPDPSVLPITAFSISYGYELNPHWEFTSITPTTIGPDTFATLMLASASNLVAGDLITISKDILSYNSFYNGVHTVLQVTNPDEIVTDVLYNTVPIVETGKIILKTHLVGQTTRCHTYTGTRQFQQYNKNFGTQFIVNSINNIYNHTGQTYVYSGDTTFLTNYTGYKDIYLYQFEDANFIMKMDTYPVTQVYIYTFNGIPSPSTIQNIYFVSNNSWTASTAYPYWKMGVGSGELELYYGIPLSTSTATHYVVSVSHTSFSGTVHRAAIRRRIIRDECGTPFLVSSSTQSVYVNNPVPDDLVRLKFLNRHGGFDYWNFSKQKRKTTNITRNEYRQSLPTAPHSYDRGDSILSIKANETFQINTNWISESDYAFMEELFTSPEVYIVASSYLAAYTDVAMGLNDIPVIITDTSYEWKTVNRDKLFNLTVNLKYGYDIALQNS